MNIPPHHNMRYSGICSDAKRAVFASDSTDGGGGRGGGRDGGGFSKRVSFASLSPAPESDIVATVSLRRTALHITHPATHLY